MAPGMSSFSSNFCSSSNPARGEVTPNEVLQWTTNNWDAIKQRLDTLLSGPAGAAWGNFVLVCYAQLVQQTWAPSLPANLALSNYCHTFVELVNEGTWNEAVKAKVMDMHTPENVMHLCCMANALNSMKRLHVQQLTMAQVADMGKFHTAAIPLCQYVLFQKGA